MAKVDIQNYFDSYPEDAHTKEEETLWNAIRNSVERCPGGDGKSAPITHVATTRAVQEGIAKMKFPRNITLTMWIQERLTDMTIRTDTGRGVVIHLDDSGDNANGKAVDDGFSNYHMQKANGKGKSSKSKGKDGSKSKGKGYQLEDGSKSKGKGSEVPFKKVPCRYWAASGRCKNGDACTFIHEGDPQANKASMREKQAEFFESLPDEEFSPEEVRLRQCILEVFAGKLMDGQGPALDFSIVCNDETIREAKNALLPKGVTVATWVAERLGHEIILGRDERDQVTAQVAPDVLEEIEDDNLDEDLFGIDEEVDKELLGSPLPSSSREPEKMQDERRAEAEAQMLEYFQGPLKQEEVPLCEAVLSAVSRREEVAGTTGTAATALTELCNRDKTLSQAWKNAKAFWLSLKPPVEATLARWMELRVADQVHLSRAPHVKMRSEITEKGKASKKRSGAELTMSQPTKVARSAVAPTVAPEILLSLASTLPDRNKGKKGSKGKGDAPSFQKGSKGGKGKRPTYDAETEATLDRWVTAKRERDFATADAIRGELRARGVNPDEARPPKPAH